MKKLTLAISLSLAMNSASWASSIGTQMDNAFNSMVNVTTPKAYDTARRGVISGGGVFVRNETKNANLANVQLPSISSGCGGISLHGGSFSFISADQFIQTFQAIGSNAIGYGVKLALSTACDTCENIMTQLEKTAEFINNMNIDSCQAAQGIVNAGANAVGLFADNKAKTDVTLAGGFSDISEAMGWASTNGESATTKMKQDNPTEFAKKITKNIAWGAFIQNNAKSAFPSGDNALLELFMSITGTVIVKDSTDSTDTESTTTSITLAGGQVKLADLMADSRSNPIKIYKCDNHGENECLNVDASLSGSFSDKGMKARIDDALVGPNSLITSLTNDTEWSDEAKQILGYNSLTGQLCINKIRSAMSMSTDNAGAATMLAETCAAQMSLEITYSMVLGYITSLENLLMNPNPEFENPQAISDMKAVLIATRQTYREEYRKLSNEYSDEKLLYLLDKLDFTQGAVGGLVKD